MTFCPPDPSSPFVAVPCPPPGAVAEHLALGLCLADDTPIAVILEEETSPGAPPTPLGWVNLVTGTFTAGSPPAGSHPCGVDKLTQLGAVLCDFQPDGTISGTALLEITYDDDGAVVSTRLIDPVTGNVYVPTGILRPCEEPCTKCDTTVLCDNTSVPASQFVASTKVMMDTPNVAGSDGWNITAYNTGNVPSVQLGNGCPSGTGPPVPVPYPAFYMADWCAAYLAACGTADAGGSGCALNPGPALGVTSTAEGVGCAGGPDFQTACARYVMEKTFNTDAACTQIRVTSQRFRADGSAKVLVDGQDTGIFGQYNVSSPDGTIILNVAPGPHTMTVDWRDAGSPTWVQGGLTIECLAITPASTTSIEFLRTTCRTCSGSVLSVTDTTLDGQTPYVPSGTVVVCDPSAGNVVPPCAQCETHTLIDKVVGLDNQISCTAFLHKVCFNCDGTISSTKDTLLDGTSPYTPTGTVALSCDTPTFEDQVACITIAGVNQEGFRREVGNPNGTTTVTFLGANGATVVPDSWIPGPCPLRGVETQKVCDLGSSTTLIARYLFDESGSIISTLYYELDGTGPVGPIGPLSEGGCCDPFDLGESCYDSGGGIIRKVRGERRCDPANPPAFTLFFYDTETGVLIPTPTFVPCPGGSFDFEEEVLCDDNGPFFRRFTYVNGVVSTTTDFTLAGTPYVTVGTVHSCTASCNDCESFVLCDKATGAPVEKITNGDFVGGSGAGWTFVNAPSAGATNGYTGPDAVAGVGYFTGEATGIASQTTTGWTPGDAIALTYRVGTISTANASFGPFHLLAELVDGGNNVLASQVLTPTVQAGSGIPQWPANGFGALNAVATDGTVTVRFTDQSTGNTIDADMMFDKVSLTQTQSTGQTVQFIRTVCRDCAGVVTSTTDTHLDGTPYIITGTVSLCVTPAPANQDVTVTNFPPQIDVEEEIICDQNGPFLRRYTYTDGGSPVIVDLTLAGAPYVPALPLTVCTPNSQHMVRLCDDDGAQPLFPFYRIYEVDANGAVVGFTNVSLVGNPYTPTGAVKVCDSNVVQEILCDVGAGNTKFIRSYQYLENGTFSDFDNYDFNGAVYTPVGPVAICPEAGNDVEQQVLCDTNGPFLRTYHYDTENGGLITFTNLTLAGAAYVPVGSVGICPQTLTVTSEFEVEVVTLCDDNGAFLRRFVYDEATGLPTSVVSTDLAGNAYVPVGTVKVCDQTITVNEFNTELEFLCDSGTTTFIRRYIFNEATGAIGATADFTLAGAAYVPAGAVTAGVCIAPTVQDDVELIEHCDTVGSVHTTFYKRLVFDKTGTLLSTTNIDASGAVYVPTGTVTVGECSTCCPFNAGTGCSNTGSGTYVSIRNADGTFSLIDPVTGSAITQANVIACPATTVIQTATTVDETIARQTGAGSVAIAAGARSVTLVVLAGAPTVAIAGSTTTAVPAGVTLTWAVDSNSQTLLKAFTFTALAGDDLIVTTTR